MWTYGGHKNLALGQSLPGLRVGWTDLNPPDPLFPIPSSTPSLKELQKYSPASIRALFRPQSGTTPSGPFPNELAEGCACGGIQTSQHLLMDCPLLNGARNDLIPPTKPAQSLDPDSTQQVPTTQDFSLPAIAHNLP